MSWSSYDLFGAKVTPITAAGLRALLHDHIARSAQCVIAYQNTHGLAIRVREPALDALHALPQAYVYIDGMPLIALCRLRGIPASRKHRVTGADWIWTLLADAAAQEWRVYLLGATPDVVRTAVQRITARYPALQLRAHHGFFTEGDGAQNAAVLHDIAAFAPHVLLVGMGMGRQERWILEHAREIAPACIYAVGAWIEHAGGAVRTPPRWMGRYGLEWLFRLVENPRRFWYRYTVEPWLVLLYLLRRVTREGARGL